MAFPALPVAQECEEHRTEEATLQSSSVGETPVLEHPVGKDETSTEISREDKENSDEILKVHLPKADYMLGIAGNIKHLS